MKSVRSWEIAGIVFVLAVGTAAHFAYAWTGRFTPAAWLWPVNESVWEHLKLFFFPLMLWLALEYRAMRRGDTNVWPAKALEALLGAGLIVGGFYYYTARLGRNLLAADIGLFVAAVVLGQLLSAAVIRGRRTRRWADGFGRAVLLAFLAAFVLFTYFPPKLELFRDVPTGTYGIAPAPAGGSGVHAASPRRPAPRKAAAPARPRSRRDG